MSSSLTVGTRVAFLVAERYFRTRYPGTHCRCHIAGVSLTLQPYIPVLMFIVVGILVGTVPLLAGSIFGPRRPDPEKLSPYECGFEAFEDARMKFDVRYYLVAILFILFDLEIAFLFPWALVSQQLGSFGFWAMMVFLSVLVIGFLYEWSKGALDWE